jgi:HSP20 family protein
MRVTDLIPWRRDKREVSVRRNGDDPLGALQTDINRVFESFWRKFDVPMVPGWNAGIGNAGIPPVDVRETDKALEVKAELPGMDEANVDVSVAEGALIIRGEKKLEREAEEKGYVLHERSFGRVERVVPLPDGLDLDAAEATFKNGVLTVSIPWTGEALAAVKHIPVKHS